MRNRIVISQLQKNDTVLLKSIVHKRANKQHAVLLLHGFASSPAVYRLFYPQLEKCYDAVICPLLPGHGESINGFESTSAGQWMAYAQQACTALCQEYDKVDVIGLSMGGLLALRLCEQFPINHLYLLAPALNLHMQVPLILKTLRCLSWLGFKRLRSKGGNLNSDNHCEITYRQLPIKIIIEMLSLIQSFPLTLPNCATDLFLGSNDAVVNSVEVAKRFSNAPNVTCHFLPNSAHVLPLDRDLEIILACITAKRQT